jgi:hypothetical protein
MSDTKVYTSYKNGFLPDQRTSRHEKTLPSFYIPMAEYALSFNNNIKVDEVDDAYNLVNNVVNEKDYAKILNPYNAVDPKFKRFPADLRNYDMTADIIRRYMGEFLKQNFQYSVHSVDPDVATRFNEKLLQSIVDKATSIYVEKVNAAISNQQNETPIPDFEQFFKEFKENYIDENTIEGNNALKAMIQYTNSVELYYNVFYNYVVTGYPITYRDIRNGSLHKECIMPSTFASLGNSRYIKDHDICRREFEITTSDLLNSFSEVLDEKVISSLRTVAKDNINRGVSSPLQVPASYFTDVYGTAQGSSMISRNIKTANISNLGVDKIVSSHLTFKTQVKIYYVTRIDPFTGTTAEHIVEEDNYTLNPSIGDVSFESDWINEIYEMYVFGSTKNHRIYSVPRPIVYQHRPSSNIKDCSQPYNGFTELIHNSGYKFSIPAIIKPFQILRNILFYAREKTIAKNKDILLLVPKSLLGDDDEETLYRMEAAGILPYDDSNDENNTRAQNVRAINLSLDRYINGLGDIIRSLKDEAWDLVDMNRQRYGDISTSDGKGTTEQAIVRSSMGSVVIYTMFDKFLEQEYDLDLDYSKLLLADSDTLNIKNQDGSISSVPFNSEKHILSDYKSSVRNSMVDDEKRNRLNDILFAMSQTGNYAPAVKAIFEDSAVGVKKIIDEVIKLEAQTKRDIELQKEQIQLQVLEQQKALEAQKHEQAKELAYIKEDGENHRKSLELNIKLLDSINSINGNLDESKGMVESVKMSLEQLKEDNAMKKHNDIINTKHKEMASNEKIAKMNKN